MLCDEAKGGGGEINARKRYRVSFANFILLATRSLKIALRETKNHWHRKIPRLPLIVGYSSNFPR